MVRAGAPRAGRGWAFGPLAALSVACSTGSADQVLGPVALGMDDRIAPYFSVGNDQLFEVQTPVQLPVRRPADAELQALGPAPKGTPYPRAPFLLAQDESVEVHYVLSNLDDGPHTVWLLVDPWNEFVRYMPGVSVVDDEETVPNWGYDFATDVPGKSRVEGTLTPDIVQEIAVKLASVEKLLASSAAQAAGGGQGSAGGNGGFDATAAANHIFNPQNWSTSGDPLFTPWVPPVVAGLTGFDLGLRTSEPANVAVEITVDVQDLRGDRFVAHDTTAPELGPPRRILSPPAARF